MALDPVVEVPGYAVNSLGELVFKKGNGDTNVVGFLPIGQIPTDTATGKIAAVFEGLSSGGSGSVSASAIGNVNVAGIGDSITAQNSGTVSLSSIGYLNWLVILSKGRAHFDHGMNFGVSGETTSQILARAPAAVTAMVAKKVKFCVIHGGTNDVSNGVPAATVLNNIRQIAEMLMAVGITPVIIPVMPRSYGAAGPIAITTATMRMLQQYATDQRNYARTTPGVLLADPTLEVTNYADNKGYPLGTSDANIMGTSPNVPTAYTYDGLHPGPRMAFCMGKALLEALNPFLGGVPLLAYSPADLFDATNNPTGNTISNGMMLGTAGTLGTATTGAVADNWTVTRWQTAALSIVASKTTQAIGSNSLPSQQFVVSGATAAGEKFRMHAGTSSGAISVGDQIYAEMEVTVSNVTPGCLQSLSLLLSNDATIVYGNRAYTGKYLPDNTWTGVIRTPVVTTTLATGTLLILEGLIDGTVASNAVTVTVHRACIRKVI